MTLVAGAALLTALVLRHATDLSLRVRFGSVVGLAFGLRLLAVLGIFLVTLRMNGTGVWLNDEAAYFLATEKLMPVPLERSLQLGLDHLNGNGYLGLTTAIAQAMGGRVEANALRVANATIGTIVVLVAMLTANSLLGTRAAVMAGLATAVWPSLILWSATMLRDILGSLAVVGIWWALVTSRQQGWLRTACFVGLALVLLASLRPYLAQAAAVGALVWLVYPWVSRRVLLAAGLVAVALGGMYLVRSADELVHSVVYRQTVARMETLGRLYRDPRRTDEQELLPFHPGWTVAITDPKTGEVLPGVVYEVGERPGTVVVAFTDETLRTLWHADLVSLRDTYIPPTYMFGWLRESAAAVFLGVPDRGDVNRAWVLDALAWNVLLVISVVGVIRAGVPVRDVLFPACIVVATLAALMALPGAPGNAERHRTTQTVPLLLVLASGILATAALHAGDAAHRIRFPQRSGVLGTRRAQRA